MKKTDENKTENCTIINGVILTDKAIDRLKRMQDHDNDDLEDIIKIIADAICLIVKHMDDFYESEMKRVNVTITDLSIIRDNLNDLAKP